ncbi:MAG TPA: hypothetical protein VD996_10515, partial [Chitinophagaceae bacterium]|nr:hypothetical protein [Chitinophagaceae bacterium]
MSNTYTGTVITSPSFTSQPAQAFPDDILGTTVEMDTIPGTVDNIYYFNSPTPGKYLSRVIHGTLSAENVGVFADGTDQTARLQTVLNSSLQTIWFNNPKGGEYIINGTVTVPAGKILKFEAGCKLGGSGTITGGIVDASDTIEIFSETLSAYPHGSAKDYYSARWWSMKNDNSARIDIIFQRVIDFYCANQEYVKPFYFPRGNYKFDKGVLFYYWTGIDYSFWTGKIFGEQNASASASTPLTCFIASEFLNDTFIIGVQTCRAFVMENILIRGRYTLANKLTQYQVFTYTGAQWNQTGIRDEQYSPHCCLNIDPFGRTVPSGGGYFEWTNYYRGSVNSASSGVFIIGCRFEQAPVLIATSINGDTQNADVITIQDCSAGAAKTTMAFGQDQTKQSVVRGFRIWEQTRTVIDCSSYGAGTGTPPMCQGLWIASAVYQIIVGGSRYPFHASHIHAEGLFKIGLTSGITQSEISNSDLDFSGPEVEGLPSPDYIVRGRMNFVNCTLRYYEGGNARLKLAASNAIVNAYGGAVSRVPLSSHASPSYDARHPDFQATLTYGEAPNYNLLGTRGNQGITLWQSFANRILYNSFSFDLAANAGLITVSYPDTPYDKSIFLATAAVTVTASYTATLTLPAASIQKIRVGDYLHTSYFAGYTYHDDNTTVDSFPVLGYISNISGTTVTLTDVSVNVPVGTTAPIEIYVNHIRYLNTPICCDITAGSNVLTNVEFAAGPGPSNGMRLEHWAIPEGIYITDSDPVAGTITLSGNATANVTDATIINGNPSFYFRSHYPPGISSGYPLIEGMILEVIEDTVYGAKGDRFIIT